MLLPALRVPAWPVVWPNKPSVRDRGEMLRGKLQGMGEEAGDEGFAGCSGAAAELWEVWGAAA
eukprot:scaffold315002_cov17-Tisochrysis_lutea.AAC.1